MSRITEKILEKKAINIIKNRDKFMKYFCNRNTFIGPSLYFHKKAIKNINSKDREKYLEYIYATLASWGMHRMGSKGAKMISFEVFRDSIKNNWKLIKKLRKVKLKDLSENHKSIEDIKELFKNIKIMHTESILVGNTKVMSHLLPELIPPIDRQYTLKYLRGNNNISIPNDYDKQVELFLKILVSFFSRIAKDKDFKKWSDRQKGKYKWNTSMPKIIDNLIIGAK